MSIWNKQKISPPIASSATSPNFSNNTLHWRCKHIFFAWGKSKIEGCVFGGVPRRRLIYFPGFFHFPHYEVRSGDAPEMHSARTITHYPEDNKRSNCKCRNALLVSYLYGNLQQTKSEVWSLNWCSEGRLILSVNVETGISGVFGI